MNKFKHFFIALGIALMTSGCQSQVKPAIVPAVEAPRPSHPGLEIIGGVEQVYVLPIKTPFDARIDTGAETSSLDVSQIKQFERDGEKWVAFNLDHEGNGEKYRFEKKIVRKTSIRRIEKNEKRLVVNMDVKIGNELIKADFPLADREKFTYQILIGRNILNGRFLIDPSLENTLR